MIFAPWSCLNGNLTVENIMHLVTLTMLISPILQNLHMDRHIAKQFIYQQKFTQFDHVDAVYALPDVFYLFM